MKLPENTIVVYATPEGASCQKVKKFLKAHRISFKLMDIEADEDVLATLREAAEIQDLLPAVRIDGVIHHRPDEKQLRDLLGLQEDGGTVVMLGAEWCPDCHRAKAFLGDHDVPYRYINIDHTDWAPAWLEAANDGKRIIPTVLYGDKVYANPDNQLLLELLKLPERETGRLYDTAIIGAGAAGLTASIYLQRDRFDTVLLERKQIGGNAFLTEKIENYPGFIDISGPELMERMAEQAKFYGAEILLGTDVRKVNKVGTIFHLETNQGEVKARSVIIATGSKYRTLGIPGEQELIGRGVHYCATCDGAFYRDREVLVIGGGNTAVEESLFLTRFADKIKLIHRGDNFSASEVYQQKLKEHTEIDLHLQKEPLEFVSDSTNGFTGLKVKNGSGDEEFIPGDGTFVFIGQTPNARSFKNLVELDDHGYVLTKGMATSTEGVFAAGDVRMGAIAQVASATGEGVAASYAVKDFLRGSV